jgi:hypothetical protein
MISDISDQTLNGRNAIRSYNRKPTYSFDTLLNLYCPARPYVVAKITGEWPTKPYAGLCVLIGSNLNVHTEPEKLRS